MDKIVEKVLESNGFSREDEEVGYEGLTFVKFLSDEEISFAKTESVFVTEVDGGFEVGGAEIESKFVHDYELIDELATIGAVKPTVSSVVASIDGENEFDAFLVSTDEFTGDYWLNFIAFTYNQAISVADAQRKFVDEKCGGVNDDYAIFEFDEENDEFHEVCSDGVVAWTGGFETCGMKLYMMGADWCWELVG